MTSSLFQSHKSISSDCLIRLIPLEINAAGKQRVSTPTPQPWQPAPYLQRTNYATLIAFHFFSAPREADATLSLASVRQFLSILNLSTVLPFLKYVD